MDQSSGTKTKAIVFMIILPLFIALVLGGVLANIFGLIDVNSMARGVPVVGQLVPEPEVKEEPLTREDELDQWAQELSDIKEEIEEERSELVRKERELEELEQSLMEKEARLEEWEQGLTEYEEADIEREERFDRIASTYEEMRPQDAAEILEALEDELVIEILTRLDDSQTARILTEMDAERARELTRLLSS